MVKIPLKDHSESLEIYISKVNYDKVTKNLKILEQEFELRGEYSYIFKEYIEIIYKQTKTRIDLKIEMDISNLDDDIIRYIDFYNLPTVSLKELYKDVYFSLDENYFDSLFNKIINIIITNVMDIILT